MEIWDLPILLLYKDKSIFGTQDECPFSDCVQFIQVKWSRNVSKRGKDRFHLVIPNRRTGTEETKFHFAYTAGRGVQMLLWPEGRYWGYWEPRVERLHHLTLPTGNKLFVYLIKGSCSEVGLATSDPSAACEDCQWKELLPCMFQRSTMLPERMLGAC